MFSEKETVSNSAKEHRGRDSSTDVTPDSESEKENNIPSAEKVEIYISSENVVRCALHILNLCDDSIIKNIENFTGQAVKERVSNLYGSKDVLRNALQNIERTSDDKNLQGLINKVSLQGQAEKNITSNTTVHQQTMAA